MHKERVLLHLVPWICKYRLWNHPHVACFALENGKWIYSWGSRCPFPAKLRLKATKYANLDPTSYVSNLKLHQCIYTHKNIKYEKDHNIFISIHCPKIQSLLKLWGHMD